jgi:hypothetical protein
MGFFKSRFCFVGYTEEGNVLRLLSVEKSESLNSIAYQRMPNPIQMKAGEIRTPQFGKPLLVLFGLNQQERGEMFRQEKRFAVL